MEAVNLPRRFSWQGRVAFDHWQDEKLNRVTIDNTPENLAKIHKIFAFHSNLMQNIIDFTPNNFAINILTQPFVDNGPAVFPKQTGPAAASIFRQYSAFLHAAQDWEMDFIDFGKFQIMPSGSLRFGWELQSQTFPATSEFIPIFKKNHHLQDLNQYNFHDIRLKLINKSIPHEPRGYLYRSEDFASNLLHSFSLTSAQSTANLKIKINTKHPWQKTIIQNNLFHTLNSEEVLLIKIAANGMALGDCCASLCGLQKPAVGNPAHLAKEFSLYLKKSVFQKTVILIDCLEKKEDVQFLRFLLESGDMSGLTVISFCEQPIFEYDLELNEDPQNKLKKYLSDPEYNQRHAEPTESASAIIKIFKIIESPIPEAVARTLVGTEANSELDILIQKHHLQQNLSQQTLILSAPDQAPIVSPSEKNRMLTFLAAKSDWPYLQIAHFIAGGQLADLQEYLKNHVQKDFDQIAPGPCIDLIVRHLPQLSKNQDILVHLVEILFKTNALQLAEKLLADYGDPTAVFTRLKTAHLAKHKKEHQRLGRLLSSISRVPAEFKDEWLYLNFYYHEKLSETHKANEYQIKIVDPFYRNLCVIQLSDRHIYTKNHAKAQKQLAEALVYFTIRHCPREEIETQSQIAKLFREKGDGKAAELLYKTIYIRSASEGFDLNSAFIAVDLGNLYLENDDDFQAESWYQKALKLFEKERNIAGTMLVNANLINIFIYQGHWQEAENLLRTVLTYNEEKKLFTSCAIDYLNWANLEYLRQNFDKAMKLIELSTRIFEKNTNNKGLGECAFLKNKICYLRENQTDPAGTIFKFFNSDQKAVTEICTRFNSKANGSQKLSLGKQLERIKSRKIRFETIALLIKKHRKSEWLDLLKKNTWALSEKSKNYYYYEYWYIYFDLTADIQTITGRHKDDFFAMHDFFTTNKRKISAKLNHLRTLLEDSENRPNIFENARLVGNFRQWLLPEDFFNSFLYEINKAAKIDWLKLQIFEKQQLLFSFSNSDLFKELGEQILQNARESGKNQNYQLPEIKKKFSSQEKFFYPFVNTKVIHWPLGENLHAWVMIGFKDGEFYFQDFFERNKEIFSKFAILFGKFFENSYQIYDKLNFIVGESKKIKELKILIAQVSKVDFSLLITGESGSGKELVAKAVHLLSPRAGQPFISVNAAAIPETLLEAELFGYKKGAFSGAGEHRTGLLEAADHGTLFLDEIADLPLNLQAKILRVLQEKEIRRLGENKTVKIDIRLISASNKDLKELIKNNLFREDLFYRLQDLTIHIPPLRERREDIMPLIVHFLKKYGYPRPDQSKVNGLLETFRNDSFAGNVRELESRIKKIITFNPDLEAPAVFEKEPFSFKKARQNFEREFLLITLSENSWNKNKTAEKLGISRMSLFNLIKKYKIKK